MQYRELERLQAVDRFLKLKISKESDLQDIATLAAEICGTPIALITLIDLDVQYIKVGIGTDIKQTDVVEAFCTYTIQQDDVMVVEDCNLDRRFVHHFLRKAPHNVRFYAGAPLSTQDGHKIGSLCVLDQEPRQLSMVQKKMLQSLAKQIVHILEFDYSMEVMKNQFLETKKNEITLSALFESAQSCQLLVNSDMKILYFNKFLWNFMQQHHQQDLKIGDPVSKFIGEEYMDFFMTNFRLALEGKSIMLEQELKHGEQEIWWQFNYYPAYDGDGNIIGVSYNATDITPLKESQAQTKERERALDRIALVQSHEFRKPVASIIGITDLLKTDEITKDMQEIHVLDQAANELDQIIRSLVTEASNQIQDNPLTDTSP